MSGFAQPASGTRRSWRRRTTRSPTSPPPPPPPPPARPSPAPVDGLLQIAGAMLGDAAGLATGDDSFEAWDPEHIARTLPLLNPLLSAYFRSRSAASRTCPR